MIPIDAHKAIVKLTDGVRWKAVFSLRGALYFQLGWLTTALCRPFCHRANYYFDIRMAF